jgi:hypothetical protein
LRELEGASSKIQLRNCAALFCQELLAESWMSNISSGGVHPPEVVEDGYFERVVWNSGKASGRSLSSVKKASGSQVVSERQLQRALRWVEADRWKRRCQGGLLGFLGLIQAWGGGCVFAWVDVR